MVKTSERKLDHIRICLEEEVESRLVKTGFSDVFLIHRALPEISMDEIDTSVDFFGHKLSAPIVIAAMTGGTKEAGKINATLAKTAEALGIAMGVGSQRIALENPSISSTFRTARKNAPHAFLIANLGASQLMEGYGIEKVQSAVDMIDADALAIHLNPLQETVQPEGTTSYRGVLEKIKNIVSNLEVPVIIKETGSGIAAEEALKFEGIGVRGIDVSGVGGTSWAAVELLRAKQSGSYIHQRLGETFWDWGIPTVASIIEACLSTDLLIIASGGVRTGIHVAKSLALGANATALALPLLKPALDNQVSEKLQILIKELKTAMFLTGVQNIKQLRNAPLVILGRIGDWLRFRGFDLEQYSRRNLR